MPRLAGSPEAGSSTPSTFALSLTAFWPFSRLLRERRGKLTMPRHAVRHVDFVVGKEGCFPAGWSRWGAVEALWPEWSGGAVRVKYQL